MLYLYKNRVLESFRTNQSSLSKLGGRSFIRISFIELRSEKNDSRVQCAQNFKSRKLIHKSYKFIEEVLIIQRVLKEVSKNLWRS